jgi:ferredoxin-NADP reductase
MEIYGRSKDMAQSSKMQRERNKRWKNASPIPDTEDPIKELSKGLHSENFQLIITAVKDTTKTTKTYRLKLAPNSNLKRLPLFRAGQYLSIKTDLDGIKITRPYSISSSPSDTLGKGKNLREEGFYELTIKIKEDGFLSSKIFDNWKVGSIISVSGPHGNIYYDDLRDSKEIIGIAGGSGITPFRSIMREIIAQDLDIKFTLLYGSCREDDIIFAEELNKLAERATNKIKIVNICSEPSENWTGPSGFITAKFIREYAGPIEGKTFFISGPQAMYEFLEREFEKLKIPKKRIRRELYRQPDDISLNLKFPVDVKGKMFNITVKMGSKLKKIKASANESVLVALERAGIGHDSQCRSGECGLCRSLLLSGDIYINDENDGRRAGDKKFGFFHPCSSYPLSDLEIKIPSFKYVKFNPIK